MYQLSVYKKKHFLSGFKAYEALPLMDFVGGTVASDLQWTSIPSRGGGGGIEILLASSCYRNWDELWQLQQQQHVII